MEEARALGVVLLVRQRKEAVWSFWALVILGSQHVDRACSCWRTTGKTGTRRANYNLDGGTYRQLQCTHFTLNGAMMRLGD